MKLLITLLMIWLAGCVGMQSNMDYTKIETHSQLVENKEWPQMVVPADFQPWFDQVIVEGYEILGTVVDNEGSIMVILRKDGEVNGACIIAGMAPFMVIEEQAWEIYQELCVIKNYCTENPYAKEG